ncbi:hypothetical protein Godav_029073 [Gossypium davidsonii]|uniref:Uncharacterized protein n=1 Tax=Gossypium davidsonii TaxID=34287 RepID=A0A7J8TJW7_GOSDV|nr:hypothetical protein [Gossypium davidsonii]
MPPRKSKKATVQETPVVSDPANFENPNAKKYFLELQGRPFIQEEIYEFYDVPYYSKDFLDNKKLDKFEDIDMEDIIKYLTRRRGTWNRRPDIDFPVAKMWILFIGTRIALVLNVSNINSFQAIFYCMEFYSGSRFMWAYGSIVK